MRAAAGGGFIVMPRIEIHDGFGEFVAKAVRSAGDRKRTSE
jgi:hypothetical protein